MSFDSFDINNPDHRDRYVRYCKMRNKLLKDMFIVPREIAVSLDMVRPPKGSEWQKLCKWQHVYFCDQCSFWYTNGLFCKEVAGVFCSERCRRQYCTDLLKED